MPSRKGGFTQEKWKSGGGRLSRGQPGPQPAGQVLTGLLASGGQGQQPPPQEAPRLTCLTLQSVCFQMAQHTHAPG